MLVSIVMPCYNARKYIGEAITSVINQTYRNWELLIIDDHSIDDGLDIITPFLNDKRIKLFRNEVNSGAVHTRNTGIDHACGSIIAFLDSDDAWYPDKLSQQVAIYTATPGTAIVFSDYAVVNEQGTLLKTLSFKPLLTYQDLLKSNSIGCLTATFNAGLLGKRYFVKHGHEDYILWLSILKEGYVAINTGICLALYRKSSNSLSSNKLRAARWQWSIYRNIEKIGLVKSAYYFGLYFYRALKKHK